MDPPALLDVPLIAVAASLRLALKDVTLHVEEVPHSTEFLDLPREIRDDIYSLMFLVDGYMYPSKERAGISEYLGLLRTNHQIYSEVIQILYGRNKFQLRTFPYQKAPVLLEILCSPTRNGFRRTPRGLSVTYSKVCLGRHTLKSLYIPSHGIDFERLKSLFSLLKHFPRLEDLRVVYSGVSWIKDMDVAFHCRLLRDRCPWIRNFVLWRRISYLEAEDISWIIRDTPYRNWTIDTSDKSLKHIWKSQDGVVRTAPVVEAPQSLTE